MEKYKCLGKRRDKSNRIVEYCIQGINGNRWFVSPDELKMRIKSGQVEVVNLTLTKDNRLVDTNTGSDVETFKLVKTQYESRSLDIRSYKIKSDSGKTFILTVSEASEEIASGKITVSGLKLVNGIAVPEIIEQLSGGCFIKSRDVMFRLYEKPDIRLNKDVYYVFSNSDLVDVMLVDRDLNTVIDARNCSLTLIDNRICKLIVNNNTVLNGLLNGYRVLESAFYFKVVGTSYFVYLKYSQLQELLKQGTKLVDVIDLGDGVFAPNSFRDNFTCLSIKESKSGGQILTLLSNSNKVTKFNLRDNELKNLIDIGVTKVDNIILNSGGKYEITGESDLSSAVSILGNAIYSRYTETNGNGIDMSCIGYNPYLKSFTCRTLDDHRKRLVKYKQLSFGVSNGYINCDDIVVDNGLISIKGKHLSDYSIVFALSAGNEVYFGIQLPINVVLYSLKELEELNGRVLNISNWGSADIPMWTGESVSVDRSQWDNAGHPCKFTNKGVSVRIQKDVVDKLAETGAIQLV